MFELVYLMEFERKIIFESGLDKIISIYYEDGAFKVVVNLMVNNVSAGFNKTMGTEEMAQFINAWGLESAIHERYLKQCIFDNNCENARHSYQALLENISTADLNVKKTVGDILAILSKGEKFFVSECCYLQRVVGFNKTVVSFQTYVQKADGEYEMQTSDASYFVKSLVELVSNNYELFDNYLAMKQNDLSEKSIVSDLGTGSRK